ncbi:MAG TPA: hypothetical protein PK954_18665 [Anaerolineales bacterium]|nr:hypothetical protein [Anaerolineales bacterium]
MKHQTHLRWMIPAIMLLAAFAVDLDPLGVAATRSSAIAARLC